MITETKEKKKHIMQSESFSSFTSRVIFPEVNPNWFCFSLLPPIGTKSIKKNKKTKKTQTADSPKNREMALFYSHIYFLISIESSG